MIMMKIVRNVHVMTCRIITPYTNDARLLYIARRRGLLCRQAAARRML